METTAQMDELAEKFKRNFALVWCISKTIKGGVWFVDSGPSRHMMGYQDIFTNMTKKLKYSIHVEIGDNSKYAINEIGNIEFHMESGGIKEVNEVLFVSGLENNLLLVSVMAYR